MATTKWSTYYQILQGLINTAVVILVIYLSFFAFQGERYTAFDGKVEKIQRVAGDILEKDERVSSDQQLDERLTIIENKLNSITK